MVIQEPFGTSCGADVEICGTLGSPNGSEPVRLIPTPSQSSKELEAISAAQDGSFVSANNAIVGLPLACFRCANGQRERTHKAVYGGPLRYSRRGHADTLTR